MYKNNKNTIEEEKSIPARKVKHPLGRGSMPMNLIEESVCGLVIMEGPISEYTCGRLANPKHRRCEGRGVLTYSWSDGTVRKYGCDCINKALHQSK